MTTITNTVRATIAAALAAALAAGTASIAFAIPMPSAPTDATPVVAQSALIGEGCAFDCACAHANTAYEDVVSYSSELTWDCTGYPIYVVQMWRTFDTSWNTFEVDGYTGAVLSWY